MSLAPFAELGTMQAKKLRAHLSDDARDEIAVSAEGVEILEAAQALLALKLRHAAAHHGDAARQRSALGGREGVRNADNRGRVLDEILLGG